VKANNKILRAPPDIWVGQILHMFCLSILVVLVYLHWKHLGKPFPTVFWTAVLIPIAHQIYVWIAWRLELRSSALSNTIGFNAYLVIFFLFFGTRFLSLIVLAWLDRESLALGPTPRTIFAMLFVVVGIYAMYSVKRYFGLARAAGGDHFDTRFREMPLVTDGIFRFTNNGMYLYAFLLFWAIALGLNSSAALAVAAFSHMYIWVHYYSTEKPDMVFLYDSK